MTIARNYFRIDNIDIDTMLFHIGPVQLSVSITSS